MRIFLLPARQEKALSGRVSVAPLQGLLVTGLILVGPAQRGGRTSLAEAADLEAATPPGPGRPEQSGYSLHWPKTSGNGRSPHSVGHFPRQRCPKCVRNERNGTRISPDSAS